MALLGDLSVVPSPSPVPTQIFTFVLNQLVCLLSIWGFNYIPNTTLWNAMQCYELEYRVVYLLIIRYFNCFVCLIRCSLDLDECAEDYPCGDETNTLCVNSFGSYSCQCAAGYAGEPGSCVGRGFEDIGLFRSLSLLQTLLHRQ